MRRPQGGVDGGCNNGNGGTRAQGPRCIALVGPFQAGKTTLLEAILARTGAIQRQGTVEAGTSVGDASKEARHHKMSVELTVATTDVHGRQLHLHRLSRARSNSPRHARGAAGGRRRGRGLRGRRKEGAAASTDPARARRPQHSALSVPQQDRQGRDQGAWRRCKSCSRPRASRWCCARFRSGRTTSSPASSISRSSAPMSTRSTRRPRWCRSTATISSSEKDARFSMLEKLADHDDELMEQLLEDIPPPRDKVFDDLAKELRDGLVVPVLMGVADPHQRRAAAAEGAAPRGARRRRRPPSGSASRAAIRSPTCSRRSAAAHGGKMSIARVLTGQFGDGVTLVIAGARGGPRVRHVQARRPDDREARPGRGAARRSRSASSNTPRPATRCRPASRRIRRWSQVEPHAAVLAISVSAKERKDDVKLGQALHKLVDEDPSIHLVHNAETHEVVMWGQGEMHLRVAAEKLAGSFRRRHQHRTAVGRLQRDDQEAGPVARPAQEAVRRPRPVRRRGARHQAAAAQRGLQVRGQDHRRRGAAQLHSLGRGGRRSTRSSTARSASRWSMWRWR